MTEENDDLEVLLQAAGRRQGPSPEALARMRRHVHGEWQATVTRRSRWGQFAMAASVLAMVGGAALFWTVQRSMPAEIAARITHSASGVEIDRGALSFRSDADPELLAVGDKLSTGAAAGTLLAQLPSGTTTLRMARNTSVEWLAPDRVRLIRGSLYVDTGRPTNHGPTGTHSNDPLVIEAGGAVIQHIGTQFQTSIEQGRVVVGVRDGVVQVAAQGQSADFVRGELATIDLNATADGNPIRRGRIAPSGDSWRWVDDLAPRLPIEGRNLVTVLHALAYQSGVTLSFTSKRVETDALATTLHGPALDMAPDAALHAILATTSFRSMPRTNNDGDRIIIDAR